jgi:hypothetical protein
VDAGEDQLVVMTHGPDELDRLLAAERVGEEKLEQALVALLERERGRIGQPSVERRFPF